MTTIINMDFHERVIIDTNALDWRDSPFPGVQLRMLEREHAESGHATSVVRYAPGSQFGSHVHTGGEEFLVLEGAFSDENGDSGPLTYVRNPVGSEHRRHSNGGCTIFVKLSQMDPRDQDQVRIDTGKTSWQPGPVDGLSVMPLHQYGTKRTALLRWAPGTVSTRHEHPGGEEIFVLDGVFEDDLGRYPKGTWLRYPTGSIHTPFSTEGCTTFIKAGHLDTSPTTTSP